MLFRFLLLLLVAGSLRASTVDDPSEKFVAAYRSFKEAEHCDQEGRREEAITKYRYAESHLVDISNNYPNWQKPIVEYRLSKIRNNLARLTASSGSVRPSNYGHAGTSYGDSDRSPPEGNSYQGENSHASQEQRRVELRHAEADADAGSYGSEIASTESSSSGATTADTASLERASQHSSKKAGDLPTLSIIPPVAKNSLASSNNEMLQLQKQLKQTETELEKAHSDIIYQTAELDHSKISLVEAKSQLATTERQIADLKHDLEKNRAGSLQREAALKKSLQQLQRDVVALAADKEVILEENSSLQQRLQQPADSLKAALNSKNRLEQLQVEMNAEKNASAALHEQLMAAQRERDEARAESTTLVQQMKQTRDSLEIAEKKGHDLESLQNRVATLQQQLQQTATSLAEAEKKSTEIDSLKIKLAALSQEGSSKTKMLADAQEATKKLELSQKSTLDDLQKKLLASQGDQEVLNEERAALEVHLKQAQEKIASLEKSDANTLFLQHQVEGLVQELEKNRKQLAEAQASKIEAATLQKQALVDLEGRLRTAVMERQSIEIKKGELEQQLAGTQEKIQTLMSQGAPNVAAARGDLQQSQVELQSLKIQLEASEKKIADLEKAGPERDRLLQQKERELSAARDEAGKFQKELLAAEQELTSIQQEIKARDDRYNDLKKQLEQKNEEIAALQKKGSSEAGQEKIIAENELLKGVVVRELKAEAKRQQLRKLIMEDLERLKVKSDSLSLQLRKLAKPVRLTAEERALFKDKLPLSAESEQEDDEKLVVAVEASKKEKSSTAAEPSSSGAKNMPTGVPLASTHGMTASTSAKESAASPATNGEMLISTNAPTAIDKKEGEESSKKETPADQEKYHVAIGKAKEQFEHQNYAEAEKNFQDALTASPNDYITLSNLGVVEFQLGKMPEAESTLKKACNQDPKKSFAFTTLGIVHYRQERFDDAEKVLRQAVAINDQDFTAHNYLGIVLAAAGKSKAGESELMRSIEINPNYADAHFNLAVIYATGKPPAKEIAKLHYKKALSLGAPADATLEKLVN